MSVCKQVYIYMSIPFNAHCNDQTHTNWQLWGASMPITITIIADQSLITLKHSPCHPTAYHVTKIPFMAKPPYSTTPGYQSNLNTYVFLDIDCLHDLNHCTYQSFITLDHSSPKLHVIIIISSAPTLRIALYVTMCLQMSLFKPPVAALECFLGRHCINQCVQH